MGPRGPKGNDGRQGIPGINGIDGINGDAQTYFFPMEAFGVNQFTLTIIIEKPPLQLAQK